MNRLEQQFWGQATAHEKLFIMSVHSHWCSCQRIKLKTPINTHMSVHERVLACAFHFPSWHSNLGASLREIQIHLGGRNISRKTMSEEGSARAIIFSTASDQISPTRTMEEEVSTISCTSRSPVVKTRIPRKSPVVSPYCLSRFSHSIFSLAPLLFSEISFPPSSAPFCLGPSVSVPISTSPSSSATRDPAIPPDSNLGQSHDE